MHISIINSISYISARIAGFTVFRVVRLNSDESITQTPHTHTHTHIHTHSFTIIGIVRSNRDDAITVGHFLPLPDEVVRTRQP